MEGRPVFIGGINRSGTSLMRQLLGSHPELAIPPYELEFFKRLRLDPRATLTREELRRHALAIAEWPKVAAWGIDTDALLQTVLEGEATTRGLFTSLLATYAAKLGKPRWGEKTTGYEQHLRTFDRWFGDYGFVHVVRHPVNALASARWYGGVERALDARRWARDWRLTVLTAFVALGSSAPRRYVLVRYEDLVRRPEEELRRTAVVLGLDYDPRMLTMGDFAETENSSFDLEGVLYEGGVRTADAIRRIGFLRPDELRELDAVCGPVARSLGYDLADPGVLREPTIYGRRRLAVARARMRTGDLAQRLVARLHARPDAHPPPEAGLVAAESVTPDADQGRTA